ALGTAAFAFVAGALSTLSPCVLPILPVVFGAAVARHRWGPVALAAGIALSFTVVGLAVAALGFSLGFDAGVLRIFAAGLLTALGLAMLVPWLGERLAGRAGGFTAALGGLAQWLPVEGPRGQFVLGLVLGVAWTPCVGPTLGAASLLAAQGHAAGQVAVTMLAFGLGAGLPLIGLGVASRRLATHWRGALRTAGRHGRVALGAVASLAGLLIVTGLDRPLETLLVNASPLWLTQLTTRF
ncbi:MAG: cytochrome c biogenesis CcdA family protein, partial [Stellaceae bacterium]